MFRSIALHWPMLPARARLEVCARLAWLAVKQSMLVASTLVMAPLAGCLALLPWSGVLESLGDAAAALLFFPLALFISAAVLVARAGLRRVVHAHRAARRTLAIRLAWQGGALPRALGGTRSSAAAVGTPVHLRVPLPRPAGDRPSRWGSAAFLGGAACLVFTWLVVVPGFVRFPCKARQVEARTGLKAILSVEEAWHHDHGTWLELDDLVKRGGLDARVVQDARYYAFHVDLRVDGFRATAVDRRTRINLSSRAPDLWMLTEADVIPRQLSNGCE